MTYDSTGDTHRHINQVRLKLRQVIQDLWVRASHHDRSKLLPPEKDIFDEYTPKLAGSTYGSDEYMEFLKGMKIGLEHHYAHNDHHPEHFEDGVSGMNLVQLLEMLCDWKAATLRHDDGDLGESIRINAERFGYGPEIEAVLYSTAKYFEWL